MAFSAEMTPDNVTIRVVVDVGAQADFILVDERLLLPTEAVNPAGHDLVDVEVRALVLGHARLCLLVLTKHGVCDTGRC